MQGPLPFTVTWQESVAGGGAAIHKDSVSIATVPECTPHHDPTPDLQHPLCHPMEGWGTETGKPGYGPLHLLGHRSEAPALGLQSTSGPYKLPTAPSE